MVSFRQTIVEEALDVDESSRRFGVSQRLAYQSDIYAANIIKNAKLYPRVLYLWV